jgi:FemAB-related protein (PEP-CTERM system-associated)
VGAVIVEELREVSHADWDAYVDGRSDATCYHLRAWKDAAGEAYRMRAPHLLARERPGSPVTGVLPLFVVRRPLACYLTSGLFGAYGPLLAETPEAGRALLERAAEVADRERAAYLQLKLIGDRFDGHRFTRHDTSVIATVPLSPDPEVLWDRIGGPMRTKVRKAQKSGVTVHEGQEELDAFYDVLAANMHRHGTPIYGQPFLRGLVRRLGARARVLTLRHAGRTISGALVIHYNGTATIPFASSRLESFHLRPSHLIHWEIIERACRTGLHTLDFGRSPIDASTLEFKQSWGAVLQPQPFYLQVRRGSPPALDASGAGAQRGVRLWRRLPRRVVDALGPKLSSWIA